MVRLSKCERALPKTIKRKLENCIRSIKRRNRANRCTKAQVRSLKNKRCVNPFAVCRSSVTKPKCK